MQLEGLEEDTAIQDKLTKLEDSIDKITKVVDTALDVNTEKFSTKEKVDLDLFVVYTLNTLYWMYLRTIGEDPTKNEVKNQLTRIKEYMVKAKQAHERQTIRPKLDQKAAARFVKHGINHKEDKSSDGPAPNKKIKFDD